MHETTSHTRRTKVVIGARRSHGPLPTRLAIRDCLACEVTQSISALAESASDNRCLYSSIPAALHSSWNLLPSCLINSAGEPCWMRWPLSMTRILLHGMIV